jgi:putative heme iron utilization protein
VAVEPAVLSKLSELIRGQRWAALATVGSGRPLASMVAFVPEPGFSGFLLLLSSLSLHTRQLLADPSASLAISEPDKGDGNPQTLARVSLQGRAEAIPAEAPEHAPARKLYEKRLPSSAPLFGFGDFHLFRLVPEEARFVAGFAQAYTVSPADLAKAAALAVSPPAGGR